MKKVGKINSTLAAVTLCVVSAGWTAAQAQEASTDQPSTKAPAQATTASNQPRLASKCSQLIGAKVENQQGQCLGKISDVVVNFDDQRVSYCVMSVKHGIFGKSRYLAVPIAAFKRCDDGSCLILNADKSNLEKAKGFARNEWPSAITPAWGAEPEGPTELPAVEVFAPAVPPAPPAPYPTVADPAMGPQPVRLTTSGAIGEMQFQTSFGYVLTGH